MKKIFYRLMSLRPGLLMLLGYLAVITSGALLLMLPLCQKTKVAFLDTFFVATSAVCVTGLTTVDTGTVWTFWGQLTISFLIQLGGLGIMTIVTAIFISSGRRISSGERLFFHETVAVGKFQDLIYLIKRILVYTLIIELAGALIMTIGFMAKNNLIDSIWYALFHSVSAFNNAGFSTFSKNLIDYSPNLLVVTPIMLLIVLGGLGYFVMIELSRYRFNLLSRKISIHSRSVLIVSACLILIGTLGIYGAGGMNFRDAIFQSVTARTAGFNTVFMKHLPYASVIMLIVLMFIGASPGSTGGGIKTTSFLLVLMLAISRLMGKTRVSIFKRTIPQADVNRAVAVFILGIMVVVGASAIVIISQSTAPGGQSDLFETAIFEVVSALGTVGLSIGLTPNLTDIGKIVIIITMLVGKVGILAFAYSLAAPKGKKEIIFAEENIMIG
jgi:trk system potassium uptake protein TrkH